MIEIIIGNGENKRLAVRKLRSKASQIKFYLFIKGLRSATCC